MLIIVKDRRETRLPQQMSRWVCVGGASRGDFSSDWFPIGREAALQLSGSMPCKRRASSNQSRLRNTLSTALRVCWMALLSSRSALTASAVWRC
jgi:hypothetical protein